MLSQEVLREMLTSVNTALGVFLLILLACVGYMHLSVYYGGFKGILLAFFEFLREKLQLPFEVRQFRDRWLFSTNHKE